MHHNNTEQLMQQMKERPGNIMRVYYNKQLLWQSYKLIDHVSARVLPSATDKILALKYFESLKWNFPCFCTVTVLCACI